MSQYNNLAVYRGAVTASAQLASNLFPAMCVGADRDSNVSLAPSSVTQACLLLGLGADADTPVAKATAEAVGWKKGISNGDRQGFIDYMTSASKLPQQAKGFILRFANGLFLNIDARQEYIDECVNNASIGATVEKDADVQRINQWVSDKTDGGINGILLGPPPDMALVNAMVAKGTFTFPFDEDKTDKKGRFHLSDGTCVRVPMMHNNNLRETVFVQEGCYKACVMPFGEKAVGGYSLVVVLPDEDASMDAVIWSMCANGCQELLSVANASGRLTLDLMLPKCRVHDPDSKGSLKSVFDRIGLQGLFAQDSLGLISSEASPPAADDIIHMTDFNITEVGCEVVAATVVPVYRGMSQSQTMRVDREFLVAIVHASSGEVIYMARVTDPAVIGLARVVGI